MKFIKHFSEITINDIPLVGGKTASLGQMIQGLTPYGINIPDGFAITAQGYRHFIAANKLEKKINDVLSQWKNPDDYSTLQRVGQEIRQLISNGVMPEDLGDEIMQAYHQLSAHYATNNVSVAVRSSATAEDLPGASFAGAQETFLHVVGDKELLTRTIDCFASLYTDRAISYRKEKGFDTIAIALSVAVQKMVYADTGASGVSFSLDTESGFKNVVVINAAYGLGEAVVQGIVVPDEYVVHKLLLAQGFDAIVKKARGSKERKTIYEKNKGLATVAVRKEEQDQFVLADDQILAIARATMIIEDYYSRLNNAWTPMDVEWAIDGNDHVLSMVQARPETAHARTVDSIDYYELNPDQNPLILAQGQSIGQRISCGKSRLIKQLNGEVTVNPNDIIITAMTDPDWMPLLKKAAGIITQQGGRTCHAAIVARELGIPAIVGAHDIFEKVMTDKRDITLDCSQGKQGFVYEGCLTFTRKKISVTTLPQSPTSLMINLADPERAYSLAWLPVDGVGLARIEFIISSAIKIHPLAFIHPEVLDADERRVFEKITAGYADKKQFFIDQLAYGIATIAAAFWPRKVIVRLSDFKSNEYRNLIGGQHFEPEEENPMLGFRGAIRYSDNQFKQAFILECQAFKKVREFMGFTNVDLMIPFVRSTDEARRVIDLLSQQGLKRGHNELALIMMCEIPSNAILVEQYCPLFDGFSIGSNDLTQLTLGVDRDSGLLAAAFDERDPAVKQMFMWAITGAHRMGKPIGICGQAPSDYPDLADFLIGLKIDSLSLNPDSVISFLLRSES